MTDSTEALKLKPCPYCTGTDIRFDRYISGTSPTGEVWSMCCYICGATFPNRYRKELLIAAWNRRSPSPISPTPQAVEALRYRHKKRGSTYTVIGTATIQCEPSADIADMEELVLYRGDDGRYWVRRSEEFHDGRFEKLPPDRLEEKPARHDEAAALIERLRYRVDNYTAHYGTSDRDLDKLILALLRSLTE